MGEYWHLTMSLNSRIKNSGIYAKAKTAKTKVREWDTRKPDGKLKREMLEDTAKDPYHRTVYELFTQETDFGDNERYEQIRQLAVFGFLMLGVLVTEYLLIKQLPEEQ